jgi:hypothetical protein
MDILAHALWAGAGVALARRRWPVSTRTAAVTIGLAVAPDVPHLLPIVGWSAFGTGTAAAVSGYAYAIPGREPALPTTIELVSHHLHCVTHSAIIAALVTLLIWASTRRLWIPLLGWWSHIVIDVFTHSADYYPSPVLYPLTRTGFDGVAWNTPWFMVLNYAALAATYLWLWHAWRGARAQRTT